VLTPPQVFSWTGGGVNAFCFQQLYLLRWILPKQ
jgi:hypothetical protein